jgi:hypothetical protein
VARPLDLVMIGRLRVTLRLRHEVSRGERRCVGDGVSGLYDMIGVFNNNF